MNYFFFRRKKVSKCKTLSVAVKRLNAYNVLWWGKVHMKMIQMVEQRKKLLNNLKLQWKRDIWKCAQFHLNLLQMPKSKNVQEKVNTKENYVESFGRWWENQPEWERRRKKNKRKRGFQSHNFSMCFVIASVDPSANVRNEIKLLESYALPTAIHSFSLSLLLVFRGA